MNTVWNLDRIYKGFDDPAFSADIEALTAAIAEISDFAGKEVTLTFEMKDAKLYAFEFLE